MGIFDGWFGVGVAEYSLAVVEPVGRIEELGPLRVEGVWLLEPAEFGAVLPSPLSVIFVEIICDVFQ